MLSSFLRPIVLALLFAASVPASRGETITVFAAASTKDAVDEIAKAFEAHSQDRVTVSYAASSALAKQIELRAPADVFISADVDWMDYLQQRGLIQAATRVNLVHNRLVLIAASASPLTLKIAPGFALAAALHGERLAMGDPDFVPAGRYAKAALEKLGVWPAIRAQIAAAADVRAALLLVSRGEAPLGIVYSTDAVVDRRVRVVDVFPENTHPPIVYPAALTGQSRSTAAATFLRVLREAPARATFQKYGFR